MHPGARRRGVRVDAAGRVRVAVAAAPERGRANDAVVDALAAALGLTRRSLEIVGGATSRTKRVRITGCTADDLARLVGALPSDVPR